MPLYEYVCPNCSCNNYDQLIERYVSYKDRDNEKCTLCEVLLFPQVSKCYGFVKGTSTPTKQ